ncbi:endothelial lipase-like isoform X2 [Agrilus planipennis]|uniref:Endothelial lipase-like isoform X1 n=1 Tax=Agrilus planipennis TaxID=224129 RepID=A0A7F5RA82_AGRPL|nr:endothelial lipase-like isoform X1 [Agrilus planipennis]XP_025832878.1 endothelial lipase-like isoform X2 [Agrilus planipennis]
MLAVTLITKLIFRAFLTVFVLGVSVIGADLGLGAIQDLIWSTCTFVSSVDPSRIEYHVFNYKNSTSPTLYYGNDTNINVDLTQETKFIIHGWTEYGTKPWLMNMAKAYYETDHKYNVILVDWSAYGNSTYFRSICYVSHVGRAIANYIVNVGFDLNKVHIIAHSLGGQVAGYVGQSIYFAQGTKVRRITGLDAAGPLFCYPKLLNDDLRLSPDDANFVDAIHTNDGENGCSNDYGNVDFRPNCGSFQTGCNNYTAEGARSPGKYLPYMYVYT